MDVFIGLISMIIMAVGLVTLIYPIPKINIPTRKRAFIVLAIGTFLFVSAGMITRTRLKAKYEASLIESELTANTTAPQDQQTFIDVVTGAQQGYDTAANDMAKGSFRPKRKTGICSALKSRHVKNWIGHIEDLSSNNDGQGVLSITIADSIALKTWNNDISDERYNTLISPTSALFNTVAAMKEGDAVMFSGSFFASNDDCVKEQSMSLHGSITEPEFTFKFTDIQPLSGA